jgi:hypothetical protein
MSNNNAIAALQAGKFQTAYGVVKTGVVLVDVLTTQSTLMSVGKPVVVRSARDKYQCRY